MIQIQLLTRGEKQGGKELNRSVNPDEAVRLAGRIASLDRISLRGLMTLPAPSNDPSEQAATFRALRELKDDIE